ncbi:hypothetical protein BC828DRAFT_386256, partial [Blastocladiella britannica]
MLPFYRINGLSLVAYWIGTYAFALSITIPVYLFALWITPALAQTLSTGPVAALMFAAVHGVIAIGFALAAVVSSTLLVRLASFILPPLLAALGSVVSTNAKDPSIALHLFSPISFALNMRKLLLSATIDWAGFGISVASSTAYIFLAIVVFIMQERAAARGGSTSASEISFEAAPG